MIRTVTAYLNIRLESPDTGASCLNYLSPGDTIEVAEVVKGVELEDNDVWFRLTDGTFVWSGGTNEDGGAHFLESLPVSLNNDLSKLIVLNNPLGKNGGGVVVGICDTGIDVTNHSSLRASLIVEENCLQETHSINPVNDHGTKVAGLLTGNDNQITGLAIDARLRSFRTQFDAGGTDELGLKIALEKILNDNLKIDVLNLSLSFSKGSVPHFQTLIDKLVVRGIIVTVAGNDGDITELNHIAKLRQVISIGVFNANDFAKVKANWFPPTIHFAYLNHPVRSMGLGGSHAAIESSSAYAAVTSGIITRFLSQQFIPIENRQTAVIEYLQTSSFNIKNENQPLPFKLYRHA